MEILNNTKVLYNQALEAKKVNDLNLAVNLFEKILSLDSNFIDAYRELGNLYSLDEIFYEKAIYNYEKYLESYQIASVFNILGHLYNRTGNIEKSFESISKALELEPSNKTIISNKLFTLQKLSGFTQENIFKLSKTCIENYKKINKLTKFEHNNIEKKEKIHIGYISGDFNEHVVMLYILPILENHNRDSFTISCYSNTIFEEEDLYTVKAELAVDNFINISELDDFEVAKTIFEDKVDILVDLSGHTAKNRLFVSLYKPAPIQVTYVGFPNTTAIEEIDYFITNKNLNKEEEAEYYTEKLYFLNSCYRCFRHGAEILPEVTENPIFKNNYFTFGVFNDLSKINEEVLKTWSEILKQLPTSKLYICRNTLIKEVIYNKFANYGISEDRIILDSEFDLNNYNKIDLHLDTFPYNGVTVVFDALIMGVPTLTLEGKTFAGREASNINKNLSLDNFIATTKEEYINKAIYFAKNYDILKKLKKELRERYYHSVFCDYRAFTLELETFYKKVYDKLFIYLQ